MVGGGCATTPAANGALWNSYPDSSGGSLNWNCYEGDGLADTNVYILCCRIIALP
jgi:hypothetical protein